MSDDRQDSGIAHGSFDASSGSAAAVAVAELLDGASVGSFEHQLRSADALQWDKIQNISSKKSAEIVSIHEEIVSARTVRKRRIAGIFQHYYPEGGWGYVVLICGFFVHLLTQGLQLSLVSLVLPLTSRRFHSSEVEMIGKTFFFNLGPNHLLSSLMACLPIKI